MVMQEVNHQLFTETVLDEVLISMEEENQEWAEEILAKFDLADPNKVLEVKVDLAPAIVIAAVKEAGFKAEQL